MSKHFLIYEHLSVFFVLIILSFFLFFPGHVPGRVGQAINNGHHHYKKYYLQSIVRLQANSQACPRAPTVISWGQSWALEYFTCLISVTHVARLLRWQLLHPINSVKLLPSVNGRGNGRF